MGDAAEKLKPSISVRTMTDEELAALVRDAVANGIEQAMANLGKAEQAREELTTKQAASELGITPSALRHHVSRGHIVPDVPGGKGGVKSSRFTRATLDAFRRRKRGNQEE